LPPTQPGYELPDLPHAWSSPVFWVIDTARVVIVLASLYLLYLIAYSVFLNRDRGSRALVISYGCAVMASLWTQFERIGRPLSWRLPFVAVMAFAGIYGVLRYMTGGGHRLRDLTFRSYFIPPPPSTLYDQEPSDLNRRLRRRTPPPPPSGSTRGR
jgi:hypothetical protein